MKNKRLIGASSLKERYKILERDRDAEDAFHLTPEESAALTSNSVETPKEKDLKKEAEAKLKEFLGGLKAKLIEAGGTVQAEGKAKELLDKLDINTLYDELVKAENVTSEEKSGKILKAFGEKQEAAAAPAAEPDGTGQPADGSKKADAPADGQPDDGGKKADAPADGQPAADSKKPEEDGGQRGQPAGGGGARPAGSGGQPQQVVVGQPIQVLGQEVTPEKGRVSGRRISIQIDSELAAKLIDNPEFKKLIQSGNADMHLAWDDDEYVKGLSISAS